MEPRIMSSSWQQQQLTMAQNEPKIGKIKNADTEEPYLREEVIGSSSSSNCPIQSSDSDNLLQVDNAAGISLSKKQTVTTGHDENDGGRRTESKGENGIDLSLLTVVFSAPGNLVRRTVIRETWGQEMHQYNDNNNKIANQVVFIVGRTGNESVQVRN